MERSVCVSCMRSDHTNIYLCFMIWPKSTYWWADPSPDCNLAMGQRRQCSPTSPVLCQRRPNVGNLPTTWRMLAILPIFNHLPATLGEAQWMVRIPTLAQRWQYDVGSPTLCQPFPNSKNLWFWQWTKCLLIHPIWTLGQETAILSHDLCWNHWRKEVLGIAESPNIQLSSFSWVITNFLKKAC